METDSQELIHRWLAKVPEGPPSQPNCENLDTADLEPNGGPPITLEPSDTGPAIRWPKINKRPRDENADSGQRVLQQSTGNQYGRKPRRKTRDDKYEYKRPNSPKERRSRSHKNKGKRTRTSRKHTMNDAFHASNVARERLTLRNNMNVGIFSKGKASSPIKLRDAPGLAFSEAQFLAQKDRVPPGTGTGTGTGMSFDKSPEHEKKHLRPKISHYVLREPPKLADAESPVVYDTVQSVQPSQGNQWHPSGSQDVTLSPQFAGSVARGSLSKFRSKAQDKESPILRSVQDSSSATPYSWPISDRRGSQQSREVEDRLLRILHVGLSPRKPDDHNESVHFPKEYCNTQDLKRLLESRKIYWQPETSPRLRSLDGVATLNETHGSIAMASRTAQSPAEVARPQTDKSKALSISGTRAGHKQISLDDPFGYPRRNQLHGLEGEVTEDRILSPQQHFPAHYEPGSAELDVEDDYVFFQNLDAVFCAIVDQEGAKSGPLEQGPNIRNRSHLSIVHQAPDDASLFSNFSHNQYQVPAASVDSLLSDQPGHETLRAIVTNHCHRPEDDLAALNHGSPTESKYPSLTSTGGVLERGPEMPSKSQTSDPFPSTTTLQSCHTSIPPGFWRQNRLY